MKKTFLYLLMPFFLLTIAYQGMSSVPSGDFKLQPEKADFIIIDIIEGGLHQISWSSLGGSGNYYVVVKNNATNTTFYYTSTAGTSCLVTGLVSGNSYNVMVARSGYIIALDTNP